MQILDFFPYEEPRAPQSHALQELESKWNHYDVFVIRAPVATGKTEIGVTLGRWLAAQGITSNFLQPDNVLLNGVLRRFPELAALHRKDSYHCERFNRGCGTTKTKTGSYCSGCTYVTAKREVRSAKTRAMNYYTYWAHKEYADVLIFDEAHKVVDMLADKRDIKLWRSQFKFPTDLKTVTDVVVWIQDWLARDPNPTLTRTLKEIIRIEDISCVEYSREPYRGGYEAVLKICPSTPRFMPPWLWPRGKVKKIVLMSATIGPKDIYELGLDRRRVTYIDCNNAIPAANRRVFYDPVVNMSYALTDRALPRLANKLQSLAVRHTAEKGMVHVPYGLASRLRAHLTGDRFLWHDRDNKDEVLREFRASPPEAGKILVASGLYEGIDLPYDAARWQAIAKVPYLSLAAPRIKHKSDLDPDWYDWETIKRLLQATGRVCRAPDDKGVTYILDAQFKRLWNKDRNRLEFQRMFPKHFRDALIFLRS